jgi:hypothetical protein
MHLTMTVYSDGNISFEDHSFFMRIIGRIFQLNMKMKLYKTVEADFRLRGESDSINA